MKSLPVIVTIREQGTGVPVVAFQTTSIDDAYTMASAIVAHPAYCRGYCEGRDWQGNILFNLFPPEQMGWAVGGGAPQLSPHQGAQVIPFRRR